MVLFSITLIRFVRTSTLDFQISKITYKGVQNLDIEYQKVVSTK